MKKSTKTDKKKIQNKLNWFKLRIDISKQKYCVQKNCIGTTYYWKKVWKQKESKIYIPKLWELKTKLRNIWNPQNEQKNCWKYKINQICTIKWWKKIWYFE